MKPVCNDPCLLTWLWLPHSGWCEPLNQPFYTQRQLEFAHRDWWILPCSLPWVAEKSFSVFWHSCRAFGRPHEMPFCYSTVKKRYLMSFCNYVMSNLNYQKIHLYAVANIVKVWLHVCKKINTFGTTEECPTAMESCKYWLTSFPWRSFSGNMPLPSITTISLTWVLNPGYPHIVIGSFRTRPAKLHNVNCTLHFKVKCLIKAI